MRYQPEYKEELNDWRDSKSPSKEKKNMIAAAVYEKLSELKHKGMPWSRDEEVWYECCIIRA